MFFTFVAQNHLFQYSYYCNIMSKKLSISHVSGKSTNLSKEQKRFNTYTTKVKTLKVKVEEMKTVNKDLYQFGEEKIQPLLSKEAEAKRNLVLSLDRNPYMQELSANKRKKFRKIMCELTQTLISEYEMEDLIPIYDKNAEKGEDYAEMARKEEERRIEMTKKMMEMMFGVQVEDEDLKDPGTFEEKMQQKMADKQAEYEEKQSARKKTAKQIEREEREMEAEKKLTQTSKQIYLQLAKAFHPDTAENKEEEIRRTEILQEVNAAYEANDLMKLLELQITLVEGKEEQLSKMSDNALEPYNKILKRQIDELEMQLRQLDPLTNGHPYASIYHTHKGSQTRKVNVVVKDYKESIFKIENTIEYISEVKSFKNFIANYTLQEDMFANSDIFNFML